MDIVRQRLWHHRIVGERFDRPADVVRWLGAVQAQDYGQAMWAVGLRTSEPRLLDVERAVAERAVVITWPMRGTIHFVPAEDARWVLRLAAPRVLAGAGLRLRQLEIDEQNMAAARRAFTSALCGGNRLTRAEMMAVLERAGVDPVGQRGYHLLRHLAQEELLCIGPGEGKQQTFVLLDEWVPDARELSREDALAELVWRYFASHGPATARDFARWTGLTLADTRRGIEANSARLTAEDHGGVEYWYAPESAVVELEPDSVHLLPGFDEYLLGTRTAGRFSIRSTRTGSCRAAMASSARWWCGVAGSSAPGGGR